MESEFGRGTEFGPECPDDPMARIAVQEEENRLLREENRALRAERDLFRMVLEQPFAAMYCRNLKTDQYDYLSPSIEGILGFSAEEFAGMCLDTVLSRICPEDLPGVEAELNAVMRGVRNAGRTEYRFRVREGIVRWMADEFRVIRDETGQPVWRIGSVQDITGRKRAEECLRESEENLRRRIEEVEALMDVVPAAIWVSRDPKCDHITGNRMANVFYESGEEENVSANCSPVRRFFREGRELRPEELPMQEAAREKINIRNTELEVLLESGVIRHMLGSASPLLDTRGKVRGCLGAFLDITDRKRTEETLRETNRMLELILENTHSHIAYMTPDFTFIRVNRAYAEAGNHDQSFYPGKNHFDLYPNEENERHFRRAVETGEPFFIYAKPFEYTDQPGRGTTWWDWSLIPVRDESGRVSGVVLTLVDEVTGNAYSCNTSKSDPEMHFIKYDTARNRFFKLDCAIPKQERNGEVAYLRAHTRHRGPDGLFWCVSQQGELFTFDPEKEVIGDKGLIWPGAQTYVASMDRSPGGRYIYYVPGAHGGGWADGAPIVQYDTRTGVRKVIAFPFPFYHEKYGYITGGTYSAVLDDTGERLCILWNGAFTDIKPNGKADTFGHCAVMLVHIPASEREE